MLVRIQGTNPDFVAGAVIDDSDRVIKCAPIIKRWALGLSRDQLKKELDDRGLRGTVVRTMPISVMKTKGSGDDGADDDE